MSADFLPQTGTPPSIELVPPARHKIDESYQRSIESAPSKKLIARIARAWDWRLCVPLMVSRRDDGLYVIDGQHRLEGARRRGDIPYLPCCVSDYGSPAEEAQIFAAANNSRRAIGRFDQWRAAVAAGDAEAREINLVVAESGFVLRGTSLNGLKPGEINALGAVRTAIRRFGADIAADALWALARAHDDEVVPNIACFLGVIGEMLKADVADALTVKNALSLSSFADWIDSARVDPEFGRGGTYAERALKRALEPWIKASAIVEAEGSGRPARQDRSAGELVEEARPDSLPSPEGGSVDAGDRNACEPPESDDASDGIVAPEAVAAAADHAAATAASNVRDVAKGTPKAATVAAVVEQMPKVRGGWVEKYQATVDAARAHLTQRGFNVTALGSGHSASARRYHVSGYTGEFSDHQLIGLARHHGFKEA